MSNSNKNGMITHGFKRHKCKQQCPLGGYKIKQNVSPLDYMLYTE